MQGHSIFDLGSAPLRVKSHDQHVTQEFVGARRQAGGASGVSCCHVIHFDPLDNPWTTSNDL